MSSTNSSPPLDILIVTVNEHYYIPKFLESVVESDDLRIVGLTTVPPALGTQNVVSFALQLFRAFGPLVFAKHGLFYGKYMLLDALSRVLGSESVYSPKRLAQRHDIDYRHVNDINSDEYVDYARSKSPDVLVSVAATQKFESKLLSVPTDRAINVHSSLLPEYRGVSPSFWTLLHGEDETGITVHEMAEDIDTGLIIHQERIPIYEDDSLHSLNTRVAERGSDVLLRALHEIRSGTVSTEPIDPDEGSYYSTPTREDVKKFRQKGNRFF